MLILPKQVTDPLSTDGESTILANVLEFLSQPWHGGISAAVAIAALGVAIYTTFWRRQRGGGGKGGDASVENADGEAFGGKGGKGGGMFGSGGAGGSAKVIGGKGKARGGDGGDAG